MSVYIATEYRRQGLATQLASHCIGHAPRIGVATLLGFIFGHNLPSLTLFEKLGFCRWGCLPQVAVLDGMPRDVIILGRRV
jgi:phosphinothricin acetyltransferase